MKLEKPICYAYFTYYFVISDIHEQIYKIKGNSPLKKTVRQHHFREYANYLHFIDM